MKRTSFVVTAFGAALALGAPGVRAQDQTTGTPDVQVRPPVAAPSAPPRGDAQPSKADTPQVTISAEKLERIYHIRQLEAMLTNAVKAGASTFASQVQVEPSTLFVTSSARARGHELEDYGVFFDVDVPTILPSVLWNVQMRQQQIQDLYTLRQAIADPRTSESIRRVAQLEMRNLERRLGLPPSQSGAGGGQSSVARGMAVAATTDATPIAQPDVPPVPPLETRDPMEVYTEAIKDKLIDAMLSYGSALRLDDSEWLTIAARSSDVAPGQLDDSASILIRIKGADLSAYMLKKISRDEVIKKVEIKVG